MFQFDNEAQDGRKDFLHTPSTEENRYRDIAIYALETITTTGDVMVGVRIVLEHLAEQMEVHCFHIVERVSVLDKDLPTVNFGAETPYAATYHWDAEHQLLSLGAKKIVHYPFSELLEAGDAEDGVFSIGDCDSVTNDPASLKGLFRWVKAQSLLGYGIYDEDGLNFGLCLYDTSKSRIWSEYEKRSLRAVTKLIANSMATYRASQLAASQIDRFVNYDRVTGLYSKEKFLEAGQRLLALKREGVSRFCMVYTDICNFRYINETYGYEVGDKVLRDFGTMLKESSNDGVSCRIHSDHFVTLACFSTNERLIDHIARITSVFSSEFEKDYPGSNLCLSSGIYCFHDFDHNMTEAIDNANLARKEVKRTPKIGYKIYDDVLYRKKMRIGEIEASMYQALDNDEFQVYIQPKYNIEDNSIIGGEALVRWLRPDGTMLLPGDFIPLFEQNGFIEEMDFYVLDQVCKKLSEYRANGQKVVPISVNQSRYLFNNPEYVYRVKYMIDKYGVPPELIELELTETMVMQNIESVIDILYQLKAIGAKLSIDDFGSGYSSLNLLKKLPVDIIKLDRTFLDESVQSEPTRIIIESLIGLANRLGIRAICEGIETKEQAEFLRSISCNYVQGYLYAKPMPIVEYDRIICAL